MKIFVSDLEKNIEEGKTRGYSGSKHEGEVKHVLHNQLEHAWKEERQSLLEELEELTGVRIELDDLKSKHMRFEEEAQSLLMKEAKWAESAVAKEAEWSEKEEQLVMARNAEITKCLMLQQEVISLKEKSQWKENLDEVIRLKADLHAAKKLIEQLEVRIKVIKLSRNFSAEQQTVDKAGASSSSSSSSQKADTEKYSPPTVDLDARIIALQFEVSDAEAVMNKIQDEAEADAARFREEIVALKAELESSNQEKEALKLEIKSLETRHVDEKDDVKTKVRKELRLDERSGELFEAHSTLQRVRKDLCDSEEQVELSRTLCAKLTKDLEFKEDETSSTIAKLKKGKEDSTQELDKAT